MNRLLISLWRLLLSAGVTLLILLAVYVSLGREMAPMLSSYRLQIEDLAKERGFDLQIGRLEGGWSGLSPLIYARDLSLGEGSEQLHLDQVIIRVDVLRTLWHQQLSVAHVHIDGLQLQLREDERGRWQLQGLPQPAEQAPLNLDQLLQKTAGLEQISLQGSRLILEPYQQDPLALTYIELNLKQGSEQRLDGRVRLPDGQPLSFVVQARLDRQQWQKSTVQLYLNLPQSNWANWWHKPWPAELQLQQLTLGGEFWAVWSGGALRHLTAYLEAPQLVGQRADLPAFAVSDLKAQVFYRRQTRAEEWVIEGLSFKQAEQRFAPARIGVQRKAAAKEVDEHWQLSLDQLQLAPIHELLASFVRFPEKAQEIAQALQPSGTVRNLNLLWRPAAPLEQRARFSASLEQISVGAYLGSPAISNASGRVEGGLTEGELRIDSRDFSLHLDKFFPEPWHYQTGQGSLRWSYEPGLFSLWSPYVQVSGEIGQAAADFMLRLYADPELEDYLDLRVGLRNGNSAQTTLYLPSRAPAMNPALVDWLGQAIKGGVVEQGWFQYQGSVMRGALPSSRKLNLYLQVEDAELAFQPGWPHLRDIQAELFLEGVALTVLAPEAKLAQASLSQIQVDLPYQPGQPPRLTVQGQINSDLGDTLALLQTAPTPAAKVFSGWRGTGELQGSLQLAVELRKGAPLPHVQVEFSTAGAELHIPQANLDLRKLSGDFLYDSYTGLTASEINAQVLGSDVQAQARALGTHQQAHTQILAQGKVAYSRLATWLALPKELPVQGEVPYELRLDLNGADSLLQIDSSLQGLAVNLPEPFAKAANERRNSELRMTLEGQERRYWAKYGERASMVFAAPVNALAQGRGELSLGGQARLPVTRGLRLTGSLAQLNWAEWQTVLAPLAQRNNSAVTSVFVGGQLQIKRFNGFGLEIAPLALQLSQLEQAWQLQLESAVVAGTVGIPLRAKAPLDVHLKYLDLPQKPEALQAVSQIEPGDPLVGLDPRTLPAMDVRVERLSQGQRTIGAWAFSLTSDEQGAWLDEVSLGLRGALLTGSGQWRYAESGTSTEFTGRLAGSNLADVLKAWDFVPSVSSQRFRLDIQGAWPGSPAALSLQNYSGVLGGNLWDGQFHEIEGAASALRVFGLLNFNSLGRRLRLDFSDMFSKGLSYDRFKGVLHVENGIYRTAEPMHIKGPSSDLELQGTLDMRTDQVDAKVLVTLPVSNNLTLAALLAGAPAVGGALFLAEKLLGNEIARFATVQYDVHGPISDPHIDFEKPFEKPE